MKSFLLSMLSAAFFLSGGPVLAEAVVIKSDAAALPIGSMIAGGSVIKVDSGENVTLIMQSGEARIIEGPFSGVLPATGGDSGATKAIANLLRSRGRGVSRLGAVRNATQTDKERPVINLLLGEAVCLSSRTRPAMMIPPRNQPQKLVLTGSSSAEVEWPASTAQVDWPDVLPLINGVTYFVVLDGLELAEVRIRLIDDEGAPIGERAKARIDAGCFADALRLLNQVE